MSKNINRFTSNKKFNYLLRKINESIGRDDWDYWAREIDKLVGGVNNKFSTVDTIDK